MLVVSLLMCWRYISGTSANMLARMLADALVGSDLLL